MILVYYCINNRDTNCSFWRENGVALNDESKRSKLNLLKELTSFNKKTLDFLNNSRMEQSIFKVSTWFSVLTIFLLLFIINQRVYFKSSFCCVSIFDALKRDQNLLLNVDFVSRF